MDVRPISDAEVGDCARVYAAAYGRPPWNEALDPGQICACIRRFIGRDGFCAWRAEAGGEIVGVALGVVVPYVGGAFLRLEDLCVAPDHQRSGVGGAFIREIERLSQALGCDSMLLATQPDVPAHDFYLKQGLRDIPTAYMFREYHPSEATP